MNHEMEKLLVNTFILSNKRERVLYELGRADKREKCMGKLEFWFIPEHVHRLNGIRSWVIEDSVDAMRALGARGQAYLMRSEMEECRMMPWEDAVREAVDSADGFVFISEAMLVYYVGEDYNYTKYCLYSERPQAGR